MIVVLDEGVATSAVEFTLPPQSSAGGLSLVPSERPPAEAPSITIRKIVEPNTVESDRTQLANEAAGRAQQHLRW